MIGNRIIKLESVDSTNLFLRNKIDKESIPEGTLVCTKEQTKGRGQRGNVWATEINQNLIFSFVLYPSFLPAEKQFLISKITSLAVCNFLNKHLDNVKIKWPNDIYVNDLKISGILIENTLSGSNIDNSVVGVGLNVNQIEFDKSIPNPISMKLHTNKVFDLDLLLTELCVQLNFWYNNLIDGNISKINSEYLNYLYKYMEKHRFEDKNGEFTAVIQGVDRIGQLCLKDDNGAERLYAFKEIAFCK